MSARVDADWKARYAKLEADFASTRDAAATRDAAYRDLETRYRTLGANHTETQTSIRGLTSQLSEAAAQPDNLMVIEGVGNDNGSIGHDRGSNGSIGHHTVSIGHHGGFTHDRGGPAEASEAAVGSVKPLPLVVGQAEGARRAALESAGLLVVINQKPVSNPAEVGKVIEQTPKTGDLVKGSTITLVIGVDEGSDTSAATNEEAGIAVPKDGVVNLTG